MLMGLQHATTLARFVVVALVAVDEKPARACVKFVPRVRVPMPRESVPQAPEPRITHFLADVQVAVGLKAHAASGAVGLVGAEAVRVIVDHDAVITEPTAKQRSERLDGYGRCTGPMIE